MKYADSGVNIDAATRALARAKVAVRSTWDSRVKSEMGAFGGLYQPAPGEPLLVASVDGVGTKVMVAVQAGRFDTLGQLSQYGVSGRMPPRIINLFEVINVEHQTDNPGPITSCPIRVAWSAPS